MPQLRTQKSRRSLWIGAAVAVIVVFFVARFMLRDRLPVRAVQVRHETIVNTVSTNGRVEPEHPYQFYSPLATTVKAVHVQAGDVVPAGKLLIELDDLSARAQVAAAESGVKSAQAMLDAVNHNGTQAERQSSAAEITQNKLTRDQAQRDLDALTRLASTGAAAPSEVASARHRLASAQATLDAAQQNSQSRYSPQEIDRARASLADAEAALASAKHVLQQTRIIAPIKGTVYFMDAAASQFAETGKLLLQIADLKDERIRAYFDEPDLGRLALGQSVLTRWDARPGVVWNGRITRLPAAVVTYTTRIVGEVLIALDESESGLLPDTNVTVQVTTSSQPSALAMPREALHSENGKYFAFKVDGDQLRRTTVTIGPPTLTEVSILSGLQEGDWVATASTNGQPLQEGMPIQVQR
jgi:HlyD family secretion protein